ncbi:MAG: hypothetical protein JSW40_07730 [Candidatus Omnitrophota bacterium]|nr:MAG: hypothetical protein JSW40_07730 [Candidatus Omnitrophota bacterium]
MITFEDFSKLDLKIGKIVEVEPHPQADKLYLLKVDIGRCVRQLVAGIKPFYSPQELKGKSIVVLVNLEPKNIRGYTSEGMLLAAQSKNSVCIISPDREVELGSVIR